MCDHLWKSPVDGFHVSLGYLLTIYPSGHFQLVGSSASLRIFQLVWCYKPWSQGGCKVLCLGRAKSDLHFLGLNVSCAPIIHYRIARDARLCLFQRNVAALLTDYTGNFKFEIQSFGIGWDWNLVIGTIDHIRVGVVEYGNLVPFRDHLKTSLCPCSLHVLLESIEIPESWRSWNRRH